MQSLLVRIYALLAHVAFLATFVYFILFVTGWGVPRSIDDGPTAAPLLAIAIDVGLVLFFGLAHSVMARAAFKRVWTRLVPLAAERSTYVLVATAQMALVCWQWRPVAAIHLWATAGALALGLRVLQATGWAIALLSTFLIDHLELFGLRQAFGLRAPQPVFRTPFLYRWVRHPLYFGMLLALWAAPAMSAGHFLLASLLTVYILVGVRYEERDLVRIFGDEYRSYQAAVPMLVPVPRRAPRSRLAGTSVPR
jgi:protein-S-isoprenylcysteine O-methyltransferase Ste14